MHITVILCTYNGSERLPKALSSIAASTLPPSVRWEVLVVDNNSRDQTRQIVMDLCNRNPSRFRYLFEPKQGKSHALNCGIHEAQGDILAFLDDDVTVEPTWLQHLTAELYTGEWAGAGGRILLQWPAVVPEWLTTRGPCARHGFPGFDQGDVAKELVDPPFGTNMAFRKEVFEKHGGFRIDLGPNPYSQIRAEDTEFGRRVIAAGERLRYEPSAIVYHPVPENRISKKYFLDWWLANGRAHAREFQTEPFHLFCSLVAWMLRWFLAFKPRLRFYRKLVVWEKYGEMSEYVGLLFGGRGQQEIAIQEARRERNTRP